MVSLLSAYHDADQKKIIVLFYTIGHLEKIICERFSAFWGKWPFREYMVFLRVHQN